MSLFDIIPENEKTMMENYIDTYGIHGETRRTASLEYILRGWAEMKNQYLYKMLGDNLIIEKPISFMEPIEYIQDRMDSVITDNWGFVRELARALRDDEVVVDRDCSRWDVEEITRAPRLATNKFEEPFHLVIKNRNGETKKFSVQKGTKVVPFIGKVAKWLGIEEGFEKFRIDHSMALNTSKLSGTLCLSIHPLDYMTMSDNESNWNSCMSWKHDGEFRAGTIEMMNSPMIVVGYMKSGSDEMEMPGGLDTWNSKKWRELFIVDPDVLMNIKSYPYESDELTLACLTWIRELVEKNLDWSAFKEDYGKWMPAYDNWHFGGYEYLHFETDYMYNDVNEAYTRHFYYVPEELTTKSLHCHYSGDFICIACGSYEEPDEDEEGYKELTCEACSPRKYYCYECGHYEYDPDEMHEVDGNYYCDACYEALPDDPFGEEGDKLTYSEPVTIYSKKENRVLGSISFDTDELRRNTRDYLSGIASTVHVIGRVHTAIDYMAKDVVLIYEEDLTESGREKFEKFGEKADKDSEFFWYISRDCFWALRDFPHDAMFVDYEGADCVEATCLNSHKHIARNADRKRIDYIIRLTEEE